MSGSELQDSLCDLGYKGSLLDSGALSRAVKDGITSQSFVGLVTWLTERIGKICKLEETVSTPTSDGDAESFRIELSGFLKELGCPHEQLRKLEMDGVSCEEGRWQLIDYLVGELAATRMLAVNQPVPSTRHPTKAPQQSSDPVTDSFCCILYVFQLSQPPPTVAVSAVFNKLEEKVKEALSKVPSECIGSPLLVSPLHLHQLAKLEELNKELGQEYVVRRKMLLKRVDVTIQSFKWSDKLKVS
jgi:hypothetical protein